MTHEETFTFHAREIQSYKELPQLWYHFQIKDRDEPRPRGGLLRVREFIMKDAYSFDRDEEGARSELREEPRGVRPDLRALRSRGRTTSRRRAGSWAAKLDVRLPRAVGLRREHARPVRARRLRRRRRDRARRSAAARASAARSTSPRRSRRPASTTIEALAEFLGIDAAATSKAMPVTNEDGRVVLALVRGDDRLSEAKLLGALGSDSRPSTDEEIRAAFGASGGSLGPVGFEGEVLADETLREGQFVAGANRDGWHLRGVEAGRDYEPRFADLREPHEGDRCPECGGALTFQTAIEVGHIFNFGEQVQRAARRDLPRRGRNGEAVARWQLRNRPRAHNRGDDRAEPRRERDHRLARGRSRRTTHTSSRCPASRSRPRRSPRGWKRGGADVLLDDRDLRAGREVRRRRPDRDSGSRHCRQEDARGRRGRRARPRDRGGAPSARRGGDDLMARKRRVQRRGLRPDDGAADGRDGRDVPRARREDEPVRRLPQPPGARQPAGARRTT